MKPEASRAWRIGTLCIFSYFMSYLARNVLSVCAPEMAETSFFTAQYTGVLSSVCFASYAIGQLVNGLAGERIPPKFMMGIGLFTGGVCTVLIPLWESRVLHYICFALIGFAFSMLRGPMMRVIAENTAERHARVICTVLCVASFAGPLAAGALAVWLPWRAVFRAAGLLTVLTAAGAAAEMTRMERKGELCPVSRSPQAEAGIAGLFRLKGFVFYLGMNAVGEIASSSVTFWVPSYAVEYWHFSQGDATLLYAAVSAVAAVAPFLTLLLYERLTKDGVLLNLILYGGAALCFAGMQWTDMAAVKVGMLLAAKLLAGCAAGVVWSIYIPGLAASGRVSGANGVIDAAGYAAASLVNGLSAGLLGVRGFAGIEHLWVAVMLLGTLAAGMQKLSEQRRPRGETH